VLIPLSSITCRLKAVCTKYAWLTGDELRYVLDPQEVYGSDFPGETFRVLKEKELKAYGDVAQSDEEIGVGEVG
jgi:hypothetical protein